MIIEIKNELEDIKSQADNLNDPRKCSLTEYIGLTKIVLEVEKIKVLDRIAVALETLTEQQKRK